MDAVGSAECGNREFFCAQPKTKFHSAFGFSLCRLYKVSFTEDLWLRLWLVHDSAFKALLSRIYADRYWEGSALCVWFICLFQLLCQTINNWGS